MEIQEKCKIIQDIFNKQLHFDNARAEAGLTWKLEIVLNLKTHEFHDWESIHVASLFEQIFVMTGMFFVALSRYDSGIEITFYGKEYFRSCDKDGTLWEDTHYRAKCPACGETKSFDLMRYLPTDYRQSTCPKCGDTHSVHSLYNLQEKKK